MQNTFAPKYRQIKILENEIFQSWLVPQEIFLEAEKLYDSNPYHNYLHALMVTQWVLKLSKELFTPLEIRSLMVAGLFHDAGHTGKAILLDEFISLNHFRTTMDSFLQRNPDFFVDDSICRNAIIGTVFKNRAVNKNKYAKIMSDLDIWNIWLWIEAFLYYWSGLALEFGQTPENFYTQTEKWYFQYLMSIDKNIFLTSEVKQIYPYALKTIKDFYSIDIRKKLEMFQVLQNEDITLEEFKNKFFLD